MTSKNSFWNSMRENLKRRLWPLALFTLGLMFVYPIGLALRLNGYDLAADREHMEKLAVSVMGMSYMTVFFMAIGAVITAIQGFSWLYSRKKVDMYVSQPMSAKKRFFVIYVNGILIYFVPYLVMLLLSFLVAAGKGVFTAALLVNTLFTVLEVLICFLAIYHLTLLAVMLTGNTIVALLATGTFLFYEMFLRVVLEGYYEMYFDTYVYASAAADAFRRYIISPVMRIGELTMPLESIWGVMPLTTDFAAQEFIRPSFTALGVIILQALFFGALALFAYYKRPMEASGRAIAFSRIKAPVKVAMMLLAGLVGSIAFYSISDSNITFALLGLALGMLICQCVMEIIYEADIRAFLSHKKSFAVGIFLTVCVHLFFQFDIGGYDSYVPEASQVESVAIDISFRNKYSYDYINVDYDAQVRSWGAVTYYPDYAISHMEMKDAACVLALAQDCMGENAVEPDAGNTIDCTVKYIMKNGREKYRGFTIDYEKEQRVLDNLFANQEYKQGMSQVMDEEMEELWARSAVYYTQGVSGREKRIEDKNAAAVMAAYRKDYLEMSFTDVKDALPCGLIKLSYIRSSGGEEEVYYPVYPTYRETVEYLRKKNVELYLKIDPKTVDYIEITNYNNSEEIEKRYSDGMQKEELLSCIYPSRLLSYSYVAEPAGLSVELVPVEGSDESYMYDLDYNTWQMKEGGVPEFVEKDLQYGGSQEYWR